MPVLVWRQLVKIQRQFLWGGNAVRAKTCWVKWDDVCRPKKDGGLGIRDLRLVNSSLLAKWRWKLLSHDEELWKEVVISIYGRDVVGKKSLGEVDVPRLASSWWRDLCYLEGDSNWFSAAVGKKLGCGDSTLFWDEPWIGTQTLRQRFPRLYGISTQKLEVIQNMGSMTDGRWQWDLSWRRNRFQWEEDQFQDFIEMIASFVPNTNSDRWTWLGDVSHGFTVNDTYCLLEKMVPNRRNLDPVEEFVFKRLWKCGANSKVRAFAWQMLLGRAQTKANLFKRRMIQVDQLSCVFCGCCTETEAHLFLHCDVAARIWWDITSWLGYCVIIPHNLATSFAMWATCSNNKKEKEGICLIWCAYIWVLWKARNGSVFNNTVIVLEEVVEQIKILSWQWFIGRMAKCPCLLYEWIWSPQDCMRR